MESKLLDSLKAETNVKLTENAATAYKSTLNPVLDLFALGGSYRKRHDSDVISLFQKAYEADATYALRALFYLRDIRGCGAGERRFFRVVLHWLGNNYPEDVLENLDYIADMGRWDDYFALVDTKCEEHMFRYLKQQINLDCLDVVNGSDKGISLLGKWMPSENASSKETKRLASKTRIAFGLSHKQYRQILSKLRERINVLERLMSAGRWNEIDFSKIPSKAGFKYRNAFARRDLIAQKYKEFIKSDKTTVNSKDLFVHELVAAALDIKHYKVNQDNIERDVINKYWENLPNFFKGETGNILCMCDTSGSMCRYGDKNAPINAAIALSMYCAERLEGPFKNHFITFSNKPELVQITGADFVDKAYRIFKNTINENTNLTAAFDLLLDTAVKNNLSQSDLPDKIVVLSDMEIDAYWYRNSWSKQNANATMEQMAKKWAAAGYKIPDLVYWNLDARQDTFLQLGINRVSFLSGFSQNTMKLLLGDSDSILLMLEVLNSDRYNKIKKWERS